MTLKHILNSITAIIILTLAVYHLFIYFGRKQESYYLIFALMGIASAGHILSITFISEQFRSEHIKLAAFLLQFFRTLTIVLIIVVLRNIIKFNYWGNMINNVIIITGTLSIIVCTVTILFNVSFYYKTVAYPILAIVVLLGFIAIINTIVAYFITTDKNAIMLLIVVALVIYGLNGIFSTIGTYTKIDFFMFFKFNYMLTGLFYLLFTLSLALKFNGEYQQLHNTTQELKIKSSELLVLNRDLDSKVIERTAELNSVLNFKSNLLTTTAHHTKTPLTLIKNGFDTLFTMYPELMDNKQLQMLKRNTDLMTRDIVNIFDIAQLEQGKSIVIERKTFNFSKMLKDKIELFDDSARLKGIHIKETVDDDIFVKADDLALNRVIDNLLDNAIKYCDKDTTIKVALKEDDEKVVLTVADNGPGMDEEEQSHIFERYYQIERDKQVSSGLGLGLALTKEIVEELGGAIEVDSKLETGTIFIVKLERAIPEEIEKYKLTKPVEGSSIVVEELKTHINGKSIMLVEDEPELLLYLRDVLGEEYNITPAVNGQEALSKLDECKPDLIISDIMMAEMDGLKLKKSLPVEYKSTPFIFITAKTKESDKLEGLALGANDYIYKPFNIEEVKIKVERFIKAHEDRGKEALEVIIDLAKKELKHIKGHKPTFEESCAKFGLTNREVEVVLALHETETNEEAADKLFISKDTMKTHIRRLNSKTGAKNKHELFKKLLC